MKQFTVKELYKVLGRALKKLPFAITYHGKIRAIVISPEDLKGNYDLKVDPDQIWKGDQDEQEE